MAAPSAVMRRATSASLSSGATATVSACGVKVPGIVRTHRRRQTALRPLACRLASDRGGIEQHHGTRRQRQRGDAAGDAGADNDGLAP